MFHKGSGLTNKLIRLVDCFSIIISLMLACLIRYRSLRIGKLSRSDEILFVAVFLMVYLIFSLFDLSKTSLYQRDSVVELFRIILTNVVICMGSIFVLYVFHIASQYSRLVVAFFAIINTILMLIIHIGIKHLLPKMYIQVDPEINLIIIGDSKFVSSVADTLNDDITDYHICANVILDKKEVEGEDIGAAVDETNIEDFCLKNSVDEIIVKLTGDNKRIWIPILNKLAEGGIVIKYQINKPKITSTNYQGMKTMGDISYLIFANNSVSTGEMLIKRAVDIVMGLIGSIITLILTIFIGPAIMIDSKGPIFFTQKRVGKNGREFEIIKFRSMVQNAEEMKKQLSGKNQMEGAIFKIDSDPRITRVGKFIRKTSIDEFPQFFSVLKGDMSIVGVRPPTIDEYKQYTLNQKNRLSFKPGITGLWQISGRNDIKKFDKIVALDMKYINEWSLMLDFKIMFKTIPAMFKGR